MHFGNVLIKKMKIIDMIMHKASIANIMPTNFEKADPIAYAPFTFALN